MDESPALACQQYSFILPNLIHSPQSLAFRVLKDKYFPSSSFMEASIPRNASFTWRSIMGARKVIELGSRWRVGNGDKIRIWKDRWLPIPTTYKVISPPQTLHDEALVSNLINNNPHCWNSELIDEIFLPRDANLIKSLPLSFRKPRDVLIWAANPKGLFTVKSAYHLLQKEAQRSGMGEASSNLSSRKFWNLLWSIPTPRKIQLFLWKTAHDIFPTNKNLFSRGISSSYSCGVCHEDPESIQHLLWECKFAREVWRTSSISILVDDLHLSNPYEVISQVLLQNQSQVSALFSTISWLLWRHRNDLLHGNPADNSASFLRKAVDMVVSYEEANTAIESSTPPPQSIRDPPQWSPPPNHIYKLNFSVLLDKSKHSAGLGLLVRDNLGRVAAACCDPIPQPFDGDLLWPTALRRTLVFARDMGFFDLIIEGECKSLFQVVQSAPNFSPAGLLIEDIKCLLLCFRVVNFISISSSCNRASQKLAKMACSYSVSEVWLEVCPSTILDIVSRDSPPL